MIKKIKALWEYIKLIWRTPEDIRLIAKDLNALEQLINERTDVHADISPHGAVSYIIVAGRYRNGDYVRVFTVRHETLGAIVDRLHWEEKNARVGYFDIEPRINISAFYKRERF